MCTQIWQKLIQGPELIQEDIDAAAKLYDDNQQALGTTSRWETFNAAMRLLKSESLVEFFFPELLSSFEGEDAAMEDADSDMEDPPLLTTTPAKRRCRPRQGPEPMEETQELATEPTSPAQLQHLHPYPLITAPT